MTDSSINELGTLNQQKVNVQSLVHQRDLRRSILDWKDRHHLAVERGLEHAFDQMCVKIRQVVGEIPLSLLVANRKKYEKDRIAPIVQEWMNNEAESLVKNAADDLRRILKKSIEYQQHESQDFEVEGDNAVVGDILMTVLPTAAGAALLPFLAGSAVTTTTVLGVTVGAAVSAPVLIAGSAIVGTLFATGVLSGTRIRSKEIERYANNLERAYRRLVLGVDGDGKDVGDKKSLRAALQAHISKTSKDIIKENS